MSGTLYVVASPLGNLADVTPRAAETLCAVGLVAAEDTRRTRKLLHHIGARPRIMSLPAFAEVERSGAVVSELELGTDVALVTDAGTPGVSDPGAALVSQVRRQGFRVVPIPGPSAVAVALSASGFPADSYLFLGFPPRKGKARRDLLELAATARWTMVFFESPNRLGTLLADLGDVLGGARPAVVARELTKVHEEVRSGTLADLAEHFGATAVRGEVTLVVAGRAGDAPRPDPEAVSASAAQLIAEGLSTREIVGRLTEQWGLSRNEGYRLVTRLSP